MRPADWEPGEMEDTGETGVSAEWDLALGACPQILASGGDRRPDWDREAGGTCGLLVGGGLGSAGAEREGTGGLE